jgi:hypothetical protein
MGRKSAHVMAISDSQEARLREAPKGKRSKWRERFFFKAKKNLHDGSCSFGSP